jgi:hypothetical protein
MTWVAHASHVGAEVVQDLGRDAVAFAHEAEQHVLGADVGVAELQGLAQGELEDLLGARGKGRRTGEGLVLAPMASSTFSRTTSNVTPSASSALAATPSPSRISPSRMCSVPINA